MKWGVGAPISRGICGLHKGTPDTIDSYAPTYNETRDHIPKEGTLEVLAHVYKDGRSTMGRMRTATVCVRNIIAMTADTATSTGMDVFELVWFRRAGCGCKDVQLKLMPFPVGTHFGGHTGDGDTHDAWSAYLRKTHVYWTPGTLVALA